MIISRTPLRISFLGGGTDYPQWFNEHGGAVLATTIDKYCYVMLHNGQSFKSFDLPMKAGLGSSSAYTVGLLRVCTALPQKTIAQLATVWEQEKMGGNIGIQDQYLCSMGGFHLLRFDAHGIRDTLIDADIVCPLQDYLLLFNTHQYRRAGDVVAHQLAEMEHHMDLLSQMAEMVEAGYETIQNGDYVGFGELLGQSWLLKRQLSPHVSTELIDSIYQAGIRAGAKGGKLLGAGGGGFMIFLAEPDKHEAIKEALKDLSCVPFAFEQEGSRIIYND